jgi:hypothetical protein
MTTRTLAAFALLAIIGIGGWAATASAYNCTTNCSGNGNYRSCQTSCF